jgi:hypothetical protein
MPSNARRESVDTIGLVVLKHSTGLSPQGRARDAAGLPTCSADYDATEERFDLQEDGETRQSVIDAMRKAAAFYQGGGRLGDQLADELRHFADRVEQIHETVGELLARVGFDEGDRIELRWPTWQEEIAPAVARLTEIVKADPSLHTWDGPAPSVVRAANGEPLSPLPSLTEVD